MSFIRIAQFLQARMEVHDPTRQQSKELKLKKISQYLKCSFNLKKELTTLESLKDSDDESKRKRFLSKTRKLLSKVPFDVAKKLGIPNQDLTNMYSVNFEDYAHNPRIELEIKHGKDNYLIYGFSPNKMEAYKNNKDKKTLKGNNLADEIVNFIRSV